MYIYTRNYSDGPEVPSAVSQTNHAGCCCCCCCCSWASLIGNQIEGGKQKNLNSVNMQTSSKLLGPGAADPQIRFGGSDWHWKWLDRSVQSFSFSLSLPLSAFALEQMMNMKRVKKRLPLYYITLVVPVCAVGIGSRCCWAWTSSNRHIPPIHKSKVMDGWELKRKFFPLSSFFVSFLLISFFLFCFLFCFSRWPALCVARNRFVRDWWFQFFTPTKNSY